MSSSRTPASQPPPSRPACRRGPRSAQKTHMTNSINTHKHNNIINDNDNNDKEARDRHRLLRPTVAYSPVLPAALGIVLPRRQFWNVCFPGGPVPMKQVTLLPVPQDAMVGGSDYETLASRRRHGFRDFRVPRPSRTMLRGIRLEHFKQYVKLCLT